VSRPLTSRASRAAGIVPYLRIARFDHWIKNVFVLPGVLVALMVALWLKRRMRLANR